MGVINNRHKQTKLKDDEVLVMYKCGSYGKIVGVYESIADIVDAEREFNPKISPQHILNVLSGLSKSMKMFRHQCMVKVVVKKRTDLKYEIQEETKT